jgi:vitamin B12 transporter
MWDFVSLPNLRNSICRNLRPISLLGSLALFMVPSSAMAQTTLPGIVVEGATLTPPPRRASSSTSSPTTASGAPETTDGAVGDTAAATTTLPVGAATTVVTGDELRRQQIRHAADALRSLPGVTVGRNGSFAAQTQVRIRGAESNHTLVLIDGVVANDNNNGAFDFSDLSAEAIERIEVIRGPQSGLYGSNALGGVVNIITKSGRGPLQMTARAEAGSFGTFDHAVSASGGNDKAWGAITYHARHSTGFNVAPIGMEDDGAQLKSVIGKGGVKIVDGVTLDYVLRYSDKKGDRDTDGGAPGTLAVQVDDPAHFTNTVFLGGLNLRWDSADGRFTNIVRANRNATTSVDFSQFGPFRNAGETIKYGWLGTWRFDSPGLVNHALTGLVEQENDAFASDSFAGDRNRSRLATALEWKGDVGRRLSLTANVRHDDNDTFLDYTTWRTAASLHLRELNLRPHASVGTGVKLPTMFEQLGAIPGFFTPNPNLRPETSEGWDAGLELTVWRGRAILDVTYFVADLKDKIDGFQFVPGLGFTAVNLPGTSRREGIEVAGRVQLTPSLMLSASYTHLTATNPDGLAEIRRPRDSARADLAYAFDRGRGRASVSVIYNGTMPDTAFLLPDFVATRVALGDYWLVNAGASYEVAPGVELFGRVENALDQRYAEVYGFATPGIAGFGGVKLTWGGELGIK